MPDQILIDQCAPTLAGLKTGNMFPVKIEPGQDICAELRSLNRLLREKGIRVVIFRKNDKRALLYLYRPDYLERDLGYPEARRILEEKGYCCSSTGKCLAQLIRHMTEDDEFPHEVGLSSGIRPGMYGASCGIHDME